MHNKQGFGFLGMLAAVCIVAILLSFVLKQYAGQTRRVLNQPGLAPAAGSNSRANAQPCNGKRVGNICVPTEVRSSSLDAFERMNP